MYVCTASAGFAGVTALAIAEICTTEAFAARASCLLYRGLFSCGAAVLKHDDDARVQRHCSAERMMCAQLPLDSQVWRRWQLPNEARPRLLPRASHMYTHKDLLNLMYNNHQQHRLALLTRAPPATTSEIIINYYLQLYYLCAPS